MKRKIRIFIVFLALLFSGCSIVDDYSKGTYENEYQVQGQEAEPSKDASTSDQASTSESTSASESTSTSEGPKDSENKKDLADKKDQSVENTDKKEDPKENPKAEEKQEEKTEEKKTETIDLLVEDKKDSDKEEKPSEDSKKIENKDKVEDKKEDKKDQTKTEEKKSETTTIDLTQKSEPPKAIEKSDINVSGLSNKALSWWYRPGQPKSTIDEGIASMIAKYGAIWQRPTGANKLYLTFDEGYEYNNNTAKILDTLAEKNVKALFFVTGHYVKSQPELVSRMVNEGHYVGNHTVDHLNPPQALAENKFVDDIQGLEQIYAEIIGGNMSPFYRPPAGGYSEATLSAAESLGYRTVFWSFAYKDWETKNQPGEQAAIEKITSNFHDGSVILLHAVSDTNTKVLGQIIDKAREMGYTFGDISELK
ncbi:polysaccharide deacetylase family protein [Ezakiella peruensis]|uniref:polysaccharide deacetylase family protein n=1 Tax=Ezakiella peruensis TaxID=1464038 RepID=UPI000C1B0334|nr:polysaccharide deacetylase family protein [Ezakiella peruensis]